MSDAFSVDECSRASPSSKVRAMIATSKPAWASATAVALPIPRLAPVTNATLSSALMLGLAPSLLARDGDGVGVAAGP